MSNPDKLTPEERSAIASLQRAAQKCPKSLWLFSGAGRLYVMKKNADGERDYSDERVNSAYIVSELIIENEGGDW